MNLSEWQNLVPVIGAQVILVVAAYWKYKGDSDAKQQQTKDEILSAVLNVKNYQDVSLQKLNGMLTYLIHSLGRPAWLKVAHTREDGNVEFRMLELSHEYADMFGIARLDYLGKTDVEAGWPLNVANEFYQHDIAVWSTGQPMTFAEQPGGKGMKFRKIRIATPDGRLKGVFGYSLDCTCSASNS